MRRQPKPTTAVAKREPARPQPTYPSGRKPGRPSRLTPQIESMLISFLEIGNTYNDAARACDLSPRMVERWLRRGRGLDERPPTREYVRFVRLAEQARARAKVRVVGNIVARSAQDHNAGLVWLRHEDPTWRADYEPLPAGGLLPATASPEPVGQTTYIDQQQNVYIVPVEAVPDFVKGLIEARRVNDPDDEPETQSIPEHIDHGPSALATDGFEFD